MSRKGSSTRPIGRRESEASPMKVAVSEWLATIPIVSRTPVPRVAEIERRFRFAEAADADAVDAPSAGAEVAHVGAQCLHGRGSCEHILGLQQALDLRFTHRERTEHQGTGGKSTCRPAPGSCRKAGRPRGRSSASSHGSWAGLSSSSCAGRGAGVRRLAGAVFRRIARAAGAGRFERCGRSAFRPAMAALRAPQR